MTYLNRRRHSTIVLATFMRDNAVSAFGKTNRKRALDVNRLLFTILNRSYLESGSQQPPIDDYSDVLLIAVLTMGRTAIMILVVYISPC